jgi:hypothetical protein
MKVQHALAVLLAAASLAGCGSSTGLTSGPLAPETPGVPTGVNSGGAGNPTDPLAGFTTQATFSPTAHQGLEIISITGGAVTVESNPSLLLARTTTGFNMTLSQGELRYDSRAGSSDIAGTNRYSTCFTTCAGATTARVTTTFNNGAASQLSYATYGAWTRVTGTTVQGLGVFSTGTPTAVTNMPSTGAATFSGTAVGYVATGNAATNVSFTGTASLSTDFAARTISGTISGITTTNLATPTTTGTLSNIVFGSGTYNAAGNTFGGMAASLSAATDVVDLSGATGQFSGVFYGPNAVEAAGSFAVSKTGANVIGTFGVRR